VGAQAHLPQRQARIDAIQPTAVQRVRQRLVAAREHRFDPQAGQLQLCRQFDAADVDDPAKQVRFDALVAPVRSEGDLWLPGSLECERRAATHEACERDREDQLQLDIRSTAEEPRPGGEAGAPDGSHADHRHFVRRHRMRGRRAHGDAVWKVAVDGEHGLDARPGVRRLTRQQQRVGGLVCQRVEQIWHVQRAGNA
jgi:hypothetical protein